jgi:aldose 1-epimerase
MPDPATVWPTHVPADVVLRSGDARLAVDLRGGGLRRLVVEEWDVLDGYPAGAVPEGARGAVLIPWPNRLRHGRWTWEGRDLQLDVASPDEPHALHGLLRSQLWTLLDAGEDRATVGTTLEPHPGYPFRLDAAVDYVLAAGRLAVTVRVRNIGSSDAPFGAGMHPYLHVGAREDGGISAAELTVGARTALVTDAGLPTGERRRFHGDVGRIGSHAFDVPLTDLERDADGWARVRLRGPAGTVELAVDRAWPWLQVYSGDQLPEGQHRRSLAVEPMTCPPNALADDVDLVVLAPGAEWSGTWTLSWSPSAHS